MFSLMIVKWELFAGFNVVSTTVVIQFFWVVVVYDIEFQVGFEKGSEVWED